MWRPSMFLLCLIAALAGSPLRQAEAAGDLARSVAELEGGDVIGTIDGGVGDDAGETILTVGGRTCADPLRAGPAIEPGLGPSPSLVATPPPGPDPRSPHRPGRPIADPARRQAWLQDFRF